MDLLAADMKKVGLLGGWLSGNKAWGKRGIACSWMNDLPATPYYGAIYDNMAAVILPRDEADLTPIWAYCSSEEFNTDVRKINQKVQVANATLVKVPFDRERWQRVASEKYPHGLLTCGAFTPQGEFLELPELDMARLEAAWQEAVFALYLSEGKIEPEVVENMRTWQHSGFSVDQSVFLPAGDQQGIERLVRYMTRCPFSLSRLVKVTETGRVVYKAEKQACRAFPDPGGDGLASGPKRNFQILSPLDFLAEFTQHIPPKGAHLIRYYGWYSNKSRGMRNKAQAEQAEKAATPSCGDDASGAAPTRCSRTWAMLIKRVYEVDPLSCPRCGSEMKVVAFIDPRAPSRSDGRGEVIERILRHCGLWRESAPRPPPDVAGVVHDLDSCFSDSQARELTFVDMDTFEATF